MNLERDFGRSTRYLGMLDQAYTQLKREKRIIRAKGRQGAHGPMALGYRLLSDGEWLNSSEEE